MKNLLFILLGLFAMVSCDSDDDGGYEKRKYAKNSVTYKISCNSPIAHVKVSFGGGEDVVFIGKWDTTYVSDRYITTLDIKCLDDSLATITCELYVNGKKVKDWSEYEHLKTFYTLK